MITHSPLLKSPSTLSMSPLRPCLLLLFLLALSPTLHSSSSSLYLPIQKDHSTNQYITTVYLKTPLLPTRLVVDLGASFTWVDCFSNYSSTSFSHISCTTPLCTSFHSLACGNCFDLPAPGCANDTCDFFPENPITVQADLRNAIVDSLALPSSAGGPLFLLDNYIFSCAKTALLKGLARNVVGMAAFGRSNISLQAQVIKGLHSTNVFAICLSPSNGVAFIGSSGVDASSFLSYTPLVVNPDGLTIITYYGYPSNEYFVNLTSVKVNGVPVPLNRTLLAIDPESSHGGTRISTVVPYTTVHSSIYKALTSAFLGAALTMNLTVVSNPIKPFSYCYLAIRVTSTRVGPEVPTVDLVMGNGAAWRVFGGNSMVYVKKKKKKKKKKKVGYYCLGIMDGGVTPKTSVVIGGYQLEDNLLQFDLGANRLGFSSSLLLRQTTCSNIYFTTASGRSR